MKARIFIASLLITAVATLNVNSTEQDSKSYQTIIEDFIDSHINSDPKKLEKILSNDVTFKVPREDKVLIHTKNALLALMRKQKGVKQNCSSSFMIISESSALVLARVDFKYPEFTVQNFVTLERDAYQNWIISSVSKSYSDKPAEGKETASAPHKQ